MDSILTSVKISLGVGQEPSPFDDEIKMHINSTLSTLTQVGVGPEEGFVITSDSESWPEFIGNRKDVSNVKGYVFIKTKILFDPPSNSSVLTSYEKIGDEYLWRITVAVTPKEVI